MTTRTLCCLFASLFLLIVGRSAFGHYYTEMNHGIPATPPTVDPGARAALIRVHVIDAASEETVAATACVNHGDQEPDRDPYHDFSMRRRANRLKGPIRLREIPYYFFTDGHFEVRVPSGPVSIEIRKGYEFRPTELTLTVGEEETVDVEIPLARAIDMAALSWYSGDTHIHMERTGSNDDLLLTVTSARDIRYAHLLSFNLLGYNPGTLKHEEFPQSNGLGETNAARRGPYHITSGQEYRTLGPTKLGHVTIAMAGDYVPAEGPTDDTNKGPSLAVIADQAHAAGGLIGLAHGGGHDSEADRLLLERKMDFLELLQLGNYRGVGLEGWYDILNIGYRLPIAGASDFPYSRELSSEMVYVWSESVPTPRSFMESLAAGRSFATSGPMLFLTVDGNKPGAVLNYPDGAEPVLPVDIRVFSPQYPVRYLELIVNGDVVERLFDEHARSEWSLRHILPFPESAWIAARAYSDAGTDAHTSPVYIDIGGEKPFSADSARQVIARLEGSAANISLPEVVQGLNEWILELRGLVRSRHTARSLPEATP